MTRSASLILLGLVVSTAGCAGDATEAKPASAPDAGIGKLVLLAEKGTYRTGERVVVSAEIAEMVETYSWSVTGPDPIGEVQVAVVDPQIGWRKIAFEVGVAGTYTLTCTAKLGWDRPSQQATASVQVESWTAKKRAFSVRIIPPPSADLPPSDYAFEVGSEDLIQQSWLVNPGISQSFAATVAGKPVEAYLRLLSKAGDLYPRDIFLGTDPSGTPTKVVGTFHALILPLDTRVAPNLQTDLEAGTLPPSYMVGLEAKTQLEGAVVYEGAGLVGAKVTFHRKGTKGIVVPSSVGVTDASGSFLVEAQELVGEGTLTVVPPPGKGLAIAQVEGLDAVATLQGWKLEYAKTTPILASGTVRRVDSKPAAGATLVLTMEGGQVGTLTVPGKTPIAAKGRFLITLVSDKDGVLHDPESQSTVVQLPPGTYQAELWPGKAETIEQGYRRTSVVLTKSEPFEVKLAPRVRLEGSVVDREGKPVLAMVTVTAAGSSFVASTNLSTGKFSMTVDDQTNYALAARPIEAVRLGSYFQAQLKVAGDSAIAEVKLPSAVNVSGHLRTTNNTVVKDALLRLSCISPSCASQGILDETQTRADGSFVLRIPMETP